MKLCCSGKFDDVNGASLAQISFRNVIASIRRLSRDTFRATE